MKFTPLLWAVSSCLRVWACGCGCGVFFGCFNFSTQARTCHKVSGRERVKSTDDFEENKKKWNQMQNAYELWPFHFHLKTLLCFLGWVNDSMETIAFLMMDGLDLFLVCDLLAPPFHISLFYELIRNAVDCLWPVDKSSEEINNYSWQNMFLSFTSNDFVFVK